ncbi:MAG: hypothetical protein JWL58_137 [Streptosporangiaceae bacterium]|nr:hypothetical protein [Streptosporangiaceae bacterium]
MAPPIVPVTIRRRPGNKHMVPVPIPVRTLLGDPFMVPVPAREWRLDLVIVPVVIRRRPGNKHMVPVPARKLLGDPLTAASRIWELLADPLMVPAPVVRVLLEDLLMLPASARKRPRENTCRRPPAAPVATPT